MTKPIGTIAITGSGGFLGTWVCRELNARGFGHLLRQGTSAKHDLRNAEACREFVRGANLVIHLAARVGGIGYHVGRATQMFYENLTMGLNVLEAARDEGAEYVLIAGTACSYSDEAEVPLKEDQLWKGIPTGETAPYGVAKRVLQYAGETMTRSGDLQVGFVVPTNLYGPEDHFDESASHVIPALMSRFEAVRRAGKRELEVWGDGAATRDFLYVEDAARGIVDAVVARIVEPINLASGTEVSIRQLAEAIARTVFDEQPFDLRFATDKPVGATRRALDTQRARQLLGWVPTVSLQDGLQRTLQWYRQAQQS